MRPRAAAPALAVALLTVFAAAGSRAADREACFSAAESAQKVRAEGHLVEARERLRACSQAGCPAAVRSDCTTWLAEVEAELPSIVVQAHDPAGNDLSDVRVLFDGAQVADHLDGHPFPLDPGQHVVRLERAGSEPVQRTVIAVAGQKSRFVEASMLPSAPQATAPATTATARPSFWASTPTSVFVLGGVGAAGLVTTAVLWTWGRVDYASLRDSCSPSCPASSVDAIRTKLVAGDVALGVSVVALGVATWLELTRARPAAADPQTATVVVQAQAGGGSLGVAGHF